MSAPLAAAAGFVADVVFQIGERLDEFRRKKTEAEERRIVLSWSHKHMVLSDYSCAVCLRRDVLATDKCPGVPRKS